MKKLLLTAIAIAAVVSCTDVSVVDQVYLDFANTKELVDVKAKGDTVLFSVKWSGVSWFLYEDLQEGKDTLAKGTLPAVGGRYDGYGSTTVTIIVPENEAAENRESTLILQSMVIDKDGNPSIKKTTKLTQLGKR